MLPEQRDTGWKYYLPDDDETAEDAQSLFCWPWKTPHDSEDAAQLAAEDEWDNRDGWEAGVGEGPIIVVIDADGTEYRYETEREATVEHRAWIADIQ